MLKRFLILSLSALVFSSLLLCIFLFSFSSKDQEYYESLKFAVRSDESLDSTLYEGEQQRKNIQRDIWIEKEGKRVHYLVYADSSILSLNLHPEGSRVVEKMQNMTCLMQEDFFYTSPEGKILRPSKKGNNFFFVGKERKEAFFTDKEIQTFKPMQKVRLLTSEQALYFFKLKMFTANQVDIMYYYIPGYELDLSYVPETILMKGIADTVEFSLVDEDLHFKAYHLKTSFFPNRRILQ